MAQATSSPPASTKDRTSKKRKLTVDDTPADEPELEIDVNAPEPPSKKDLRKLKKLKSKGVDTDALESANVQLIDRSKKGAQEGETPAGTTAGAAKRSPYGVWIGNLSFSTTREDLIKFFTGGSSDDDDGDGKPSEEATGIKPKEVTRINLPKSTKFKGQNKGFAYVDFLTAKALSDALLLSEKLLAGRKVLIKASTDFEGRPDASQQAKNGDKNSQAISSGSNPPSRSIFVGNLGYEVTEEEIWNHFNPAGKIKKVRFMTFEDSGKCKGFSWVDFEELESAENVFTGRIAGAEDSESEDAKSDSEGESNSEGNDDAATRPSKKRKTIKNKKQNRKKGNPYLFMGGRKLRLEYGEDATTRYNKRHGGKDSGKDGKGSTSSAQKSFDGKPGRRGGAREDKRELTEEEKTAKKVESRLTGRIVEGTGKKTTFD